MFTFIEENITNQDVKIANLSLDDLMSRKLKKNIYIHIHLYYTYTIIIMLRNNKIYIILRGVGGQW